MKVVFRLIFWIWAAVILWLSLSPPSGIISYSLNYTDFRLDYTLHVVGFILPPIFSHFASGKNSNHHLWWIFIGISFLLAIGTEFLQMLIPGRRFNPLDIVFNIMGLAIGLITVYIFFRKNHFFGFKGNNSKE